LTQPVGSLASAVVRWQRTHGRHDLPWQGTRDPYRVWLSEVMLQQTQVSTVLDYYARFLARFPTVQDLAAAPQDDVLALWSGLGYYSRARNLHRCAQAVVTAHGGQFPNNAQLLETLPGIGRSTAAAIAAFCFGQRVAILDGNVKRVLSRALGFDGDLAVAAEEKRLWAMAQTLLPARGVEAYTQGLMDLGATLCTTRAPACERCPLAPFCVANATGRQQQFPVKSKRLKRGQRSNALLLLRQDERLWLVQRPDKGVWAAMWSLPEFADVEALNAASVAWPGQGKWQAAFSHALTHFEWTLQVLFWELPATKKLTAKVLGTEALQGGRWVTQDEALAMSLPAPVRRVLLT
jgi:A/G-specific adenine glycosylase